MLLHTDHLKKHSFFSLFFAIFGAMISVAVIVSLFIAMKQNTEIRSRAATGERTTIKSWTFDTSVEGWKNTSRAGKLEAIDKYLVFQLNHTGSMRIQKAEKIILPEGNKYIRFSTVIQKQKAATETKVNNKESVVSEGGGGPCSATRTCPAGYACVNVDSAGSENYRCLGIQPTDAVTRISMILKMIVNKPAKSTKESLISVPVELTADGEYHTYDILIPNNINSMTLRYLIFEFADSKKAVPPQIVKIDNVALELLPIVRKVTPTALPLINDERTAH